MRATESNALTTKLAFQTHQASSFLINFMLSFCLILVLQLKEILTLFFKILTNLLQSPVSISFKKWAVKSLV